jgi:hypothetical protein
MQIWSTVNTGSGNPERRSETEVLVKQRGDELSATADADLLKDRFQVILNGVLADAELGADLSGREAAQDGSCYAALRGRETTRGQQQTGTSGGAGGGEGDGDGVLASGARHARGVHLE